MNDNNVSAEQKVQRVMESLSLVLYNRGSEEEIVEAERMLIESGGSTDVFYLSDPLSLGALRCRRYLTGNCNYVGRDAEKYTDETIEEMLENDLSLEY